ncbi:MAG: glycoside hydrolase family 2 TIM barrel-domain containing protein [Lachnospiraceae bacterium]|nr:glycoside hydrolase family 2 TIM barrel-domain containing protein [Lachnospiraceae bacterium]MDY4969164.1 glycoside hydrolase family 2 TIM barrel-domain containing protein [Lachnospiraceae bacterium]
MDWSQFKTALPRRSSGEKKTSENQLMTEWGRKLLKEAQESRSQKGSAASLRVLTEYPRPQMVRLKPAGRYEILNGWWNYAVMESRRVPQEWEGQILVPFSPETKLSFVRRQIRPEEYLWYEKEIQVEEYPENQRVLLHFGAVDQKCEVYLNGRRMGFHTGGYLPFTVEVTERLHPGRNVIQLCVQDLSDTSWLTRGKQKLEQGGMFYTAQSGIWQPVWLEWVPLHYVERMWITPLYEESMFDIRLRLNGPSCEGTAGSCTAVREVVELKLYEPVVNQAEKSDGACCFCNAGRKLLRELKVEMEPVLLDPVHREFHMRVQVPEKKSWTPETPWLYGLSIAIGEDHLASYAAMRCFTVEKDEKNIPRLCLNRKIYFMDGVLDQGYWPESLMTPPADGAMVSDIRRMKSMGFNMIRKHCKIEPDRWYYHCDRFGMLVWQDMVNGGTAYNMMSLCYLPTLLPALFARKKDQGSRNYRRTGRSQQESRRMWQQETEETINLLYNHPSVAAWVLFNEGWGQFDSADACETVKKQDHTRFVDHASGWFDQKQGDMRSVHNYFRKLQVEKNPRKKDDRPFVISEYGGYAYKTEGHLWTDDLYGYGVYKSREKLQSAYYGLKQQIRALEKEGLCAAVYTQVSDIEEEVNGILTYDREIWKIPPEKQK